MPITLNEAATQEMKELMLKYLPECLDVSVDDIHVASISVLCGVNEDEKLQEVVVFFDAPRLNNHC